MSVLRGPLVERRGTATVVGVSWTGQLEEKIEYQHGITSPSLVSRCHAAMAPCSVRGVDGRWVHCLNGWCRSDLKAGLR
jgi:hypothetical protein